MKIISANINGTKIVFENCNWTGYEKIYVNGELVSKKFSWFGTDHFFEVKEDDVWVDYVLTTGFGVKGFTTNITRNGIPVLESSKVGMDVFLPTASSRQMLYHEHEFV